MVWAALCSQEQSPTGRLFLFVKVEGRKAGKGAQMLDFESARRVCTTLRGYRWGKGHMSHSRLMIDVLTDSPTWSN
jgi:hypothetical protein